PLCANRREVRHGSNCATVLHSAARRSAGQWFRCGVRYHTGQAQGILMNTMYIFPVLGLFWAILALICAILLFRRALMLRYQPQSSVLHILLATVLAVIGVFSFYYCGIFLLFIYADA
ncbi:MAG TPA: hypothetical protein VFT66_05740, partial [Roseiflexaceae bacterium]|nr:hypothetical protein [Roseiflexaceae bacterium]